ncbi:hypothetical protein HXX76_007096 [Chlamydomonas incerta]|uniref:Protein kinase domain-containing protein n=1 Tax=Chlamydomonas incerta TaxID=51695 RepID=A0A835T219_CHLIN|nr:hypothetical protein HXX76_007096 [Chlamydomonas incerta]|eukprot:KAG2435901.1 hypothetical protein HXX76_007096 [Chlamydomonas incerta]
MQSRSRLALCTRADDAAADARGQQPDGAGGVLTSPAAAAAHSSGDGSGGAEWPNTTTSPFVAGAAQAALPRAGEPPLPQSPLQAAAAISQDPVTPSAARMAPPSVPASALVVSWVLGAEGKAPVSARSAIPARVSPGIGNAAGAAASSPVHRQAAPGASGSSAGSFVTATAVAVADGSAGTAPLPGHGTQLHGEHLHHLHDLERSPGPQWRSADGVMGARVLDTQFSFGADVGTGAGGLGPAPRVAGVSPLLLASVGMMLASSMSEPAWTSGSPDECLSSAAGTHHTPTGNGGVGGGGGGGGNGSMGAAGGGAGHGSMGAARTAATTGTSTTAETAAAAAASSSAGSKVTGVAARRGSTSTARSGADAAAAAGSTAPAQPRVITMATKGAAVSPRSMQLEAAALEAATQQAREYAAAGTAAASCTATLGTSSGGSRAALHLHPTGGSDRGDASAAAAGAAVAATATAATRHTRGGAIRSGGGGSGSARSGAVGSGGAGGGSSLAAQPAAPPGPSSGLAMVHVYPRSSRPQVPSTGAAAAAGAVLLPRSDSLPRCSAEAAAAAATAAAAAVSVSESCLASTVANSGADGLGVAGAGGAAGREGRAAWAAALYAADGGGGGGDDAASDLDSEFSVGGDVEGGPRWRCADVLPAFLAHQAAPAAVAATAAASEAAAMEAAPGAGAGGSSTATDSTCRSLSLNPQGGNAGNGALAAHTRARPARARSPSHGGRSARRSGRSGEGGAAGGVDREGAVASGGGGAARSGAVGSGAGGEGARRSMRLAVFPGHQASWLALQMHFFGGAVGASGAMEPRVPLSALASLDLPRLSREVSALVWIGQGGGGAVFQGLWQGARVAVKFLLAAGPAHVDATALEAIVSLSVAHPNVVHTYCAEVARVDEASLAEPPAGARGGRGGGGAAGGGAGRRGSAAGGGHDVHEDEDAAVTALYNALLMETADVSQPLAPPPPQQQQPPSKAGSAASDAVLPPQHLPPAAPAGGAAGAVAATTASRRSSSTAAGAASAGSGAEGTASQRLPPPFAESHATTSFFESHEGFGEPDPASNDRAWSVRHVLHYMKAQPNTYLTHIIMEYCDRGSLLNAIKRGIFRLEPEAAAEAAEATGPSSASSLRSTAHSSDPEGWATTAAAAAASSAASGGRAGLTPIPEAAADSVRFPRRVVLRAILRTARDIAQGMAHLHANGIIHGDLKPGNVLLRGCRSDRRGFVAAVADFGLSKVVRGDQPLELDRWSTVTVMAPETIQGRWHKASDVYAFGILLWQLVTSEVMPYMNLTVGQILLGVSQGTLRPEWPAGAHPALVRLGRACLATNASERPSFDAIAKVLTRIETNVRNELRDQQRQQRQQRQQLQQLAVPAFRALVARRRQHA